MPKGFKQTSQIITIGASVVESAATTFTETEVDLNLDPLNNEVFVVLAANLDCSFPEALAGTTTGVRCQVTTTSQTGIIPLSSPKTIAKLNQQIQASGFADGGVGFTNAAMETPPSTLEYIAIIATNNFFLGVEGVGNLNAKTGNCKLWGYRARADPSVYAALVQSELLS